MKGRKSKSWAMAYCGMAAALSVALMLLGAVFPIAMFIAPAVASFLIATVCVECGKTMALTAYGAVSLLSLLFVPDKEVALTFKYSHSLALFVFIYIHQMQNNMRLHFFRYLIELFTDQSSSRCYIIGTRATLVIRFGTSLGSRTIAFMVESQQLSANNRTV